MSDFTKVLVALAADPIDPDEETAYFVSYTDNENIAYAHITTFEKLWVTSDRNEIGCRIESFTT